MNHPLQIRPGQMYQGAKPVRDPEYKRFIKRLPCVGCGRTWSIDPIHTGPHALNQKASDMDTIPGCRRCHNEFDADPYGFAERKHLDIPALIRRFQRVLLQTERTSRMNRDDALRIAESNARLPLCAFIAVNEASAELSRAMGIHGPMRGMHEGYAVILEELDELWDEIKQHNPNRQAIRAEAIQVAAMALRFIADVCGDPQ